jgi:DNA polymerase alpha subunit B
VSMLVGAEMRRHTTRRSTSRRRMLIPRQIVDSSLVVNPAYLSRPHSAGTFAKILVHPSNRDELESGMDTDLDGGMREHGIWERARSEIWRI